MWYVYEYEYDFLKFVLVLIVNRLGVFIWECEKIIKLYNS